MSDITSEQAGANAATSDTPSRAQAAVRAHSKAATATAVTKEAPSAPKAAAAVASETTQRSDDRPPPRKKRPSISPQMSRASRSSRSKKKQRKRKPDDDLQSQRQRKARRLDVDNDHGHSGGIVSLSTAGPAPDGVAISDGDAVVPAVPFAHPMAPTSDAVPLAGTVLPADAVLPAGASPPVSVKGTAASPTETRASPTDAVLFAGGDAPAIVPLVGTAAPTGTIPPANAISPGGPATSVGSDVTPASAQYPANGAALVNSARALLSPPNSRPLEADSRRSSVASVAAALVFKPKTRRRWRMNEDLFPDVPAVEVAFAAFLDGFSTDSKVLRLSRRFSEPQVFFLTLCHLTCACSRHDNLYGADCNRVVRNFQPFADAFRCAPGSKMNPTDKCRFFS